MKVCIESLTPTSRVMTDLTLSEAETFIQFFHGYQNLWYECPTGEFWVTRVINPDFETYTYYCYESSGNDTSTATLGRYTCVHEFINKMREIGCEINFDDIGF